MSIDDRLHVLAGQAESDGLEALSQQEQDALLAYRSLGVIGNERFTGFFRLDNAHQLPRIRDAFRRIGYEEQAQGCEAVIAMFPGNVIPEDRDRRLEVLKSIDPAKVRLMDTDLPDQVSVLSLVAFVEVLDRYLREAPPPK